MKNIYIYCEGPTEESFVDKILYPFFLNNGIVVYPIVCTTKRTASQKFRGGVSDYEKIKNELSIICKSHRHEFVTTMFDYYAMPTNTPGIENRDPDIFRRIESIESTINNDIGMRNCVFHFMLHEFEGILFSNPSSFTLIANDEIVDKIQQIRDAYPTPEHINNSPETAPSKRLEQLIPRYAKVKNGTLLSKDMGIDIILAQCPHFRSWVNNLLALVQE